MHSASPYNTAILTLGKKKHRKSIFIKLVDLRYLAYIFPVVKNQLLKYSEAMSDVMNYVLATLNSTSYVEPSANAKKTSSIINCTRNWKHSWNMLFFINKTTLLSIWQLRVFYLYPIHIPTTTMRTTGIILYKTRPCVHAPYPNRAAWSIDRIHVQNVPVLKWLEPSPIPASDTNVLLI